MTHVYDDPDRFKDDVLEGFAAAHPAHVRRVDGASGFVRAHGPLEGKVSLVVGGGSGHYPSYSGVVGTGFADGAVLGDVFASPSAEQVYRVARAAHGGAGVVLGFGNYAGDRLNFAAAAERLRAEGIETRVVWVTDDVASAPAAEIGDRRGIAGTFTVYKVAGAAAEAGADLDGVEAAMRAANAATFSFGVAFAGCTLPGADHPLFEVADGRMDFGLGIHGEPGVSSSDWMPATELAAHLVDRVLEERPVGATRAAVLLNGLGSTKYEELYALFGPVQRRLLDAGVEPVGTEVGELVTSLDMAGCSLTLTWLDARLEELWTAPADTPAYRRGTTSGTSRFTERRVETTQVADAQVADGGPVSTAAAETARAAVRAIAATVREHRDHLGDLDAVAGDGDHGTGMLRGASAATEAAEAARGGVGSVLDAAGVAFSDRAGGTSGILWGLLLQEVGQQLGDDRPVEAGSVARAVAHATDRLQAVGKAAPGDKTMVDALVPFRDTLTERVDAGDSLVDAWTQASVVCVAAAEATAPMTPRLGRAKPLAERSIGTPDPGAVSLGLIVTAVGEVLRTRADDEEGTTR